MRGRHIKVFSCSSDEQGILLFEIFRFALEINCISSDFKAEIDVDLITFDEARKIS